MDINTLAERKKARLKRMAFHREEIERLFSTRHNKAYVGFSSSFLWFNYCKITIIEHISRLRKLEKSLVMLDHKILIETISNSNYNSKDHARKIKD